MYASQTSNPPSQGQQGNTRLAAKQAELQSLKQLRDYSARLVKEVEKMGEGLEGLRQGGQTVAQVMSTWQTVVRGIQVAQSSVESQTQQARDSDALVEAEQFATLTPDTLVRVPVNKGSSGHSSKEEGREGVE